MSFSMECFYLRADRQRTMRESSSADSNPAVASSPLKTEVRRNIPDTNLIGLQFLSFTHMYANGHPTLELARVAC